MSADGEKARLLKNRTPGCNTNRDRAVLLLDTGIVRGVRVN
jgi:hypothetical protein